MPGDKIRGGTSCCPPGCKSHRTSVKEAKVGSGVDASRRDSELPTEVSQFLGFCVSRSRLFLNFVAANAVSAAGWEGVLFLIEVSGD